MSVQSVGNQAANTTIFQPKPPSTLQSNLAQFYERTSAFVDEQFKELAGSEPDEGRASPRSRRSQNDEGDRPRLQPKGIGTLVDIMI